MQNLLMNELKGNTKKCRMLYAGEFFFLQFRIFFLFQTTFSFTFTFYYPPFLLQNVPFLIINRFPIHLMQLKLNKETFSMIIFSFFFCILHFFSIHARRWNGKNITFFCDSHLICTVDHLTFLRYRLLCLRTNS